MPALSGVDAASRLHDSAYAHYTDEAHRIAADEIYSATLKKLREPKAILADVPLYGNYVKNRAMEIGGDFINGWKYGGLVGGLGSLVYNGIKGIVRSNDLIQNGKKYRDEVLAYYDTDPLRPMLSEKQEKQQITVSIPKPIAPLQIEKEEMFRKRNKVQPAIDRAPRTHELVASAAPNSRGLPPTTTQVSVVQPLYRPLKARKKKHPTAGDLLKYLEYHPNELAKVEIWLAKHPLL